MAPLFHKKKGQHATGKLIKVKIFIYFNGS
ncbi:hypothetical protein CTW3_01235 [Chlamydia trachomatis C/TW-3]|nr:hypothetical protein CTW3_01235 [Chlamydia trachomatis C/TW-3]